MVMSVLLSLMFPPPPFLLVSGLTVISFLILVSSFLAEIRGKHLNYSKFWNANPSAQNQIKLPSKAGMLLLYTPAFLAGLASFWIFPPQSVRSTILQSAVTLHFFKRVFEVEFIHKYSGGMTLESAIPISLSYFLSAATMTYSQHLTNGLPEPAMNLLYPGTVIFVIGITGNFYHHHLLSNLRGKGEKEYKIPKGGFFEH
ncbi:hypothetical protein PHAVU_004G094000 [Phaseolus vulgaris]|uniref:uncharacterized protein isoform X2 n=1 Tax=Phaseolus vulgaris TaxID=3885 RepID=UPI0035CB6325